MRQVDDKGVGYYKHPAAPAHRGYAGAHAGGHSGGHSGGFFGAGWGNHDDGSTEAA